MLGTLPYPLLQAPATPPAPGAGSPQPEEVVAPDLWQLLTQPERWADRVADFLPQLGKAVIVLAFFWAFYKALRPALRRGLVRSRMDEALVALLVDSFLRWSMLAVAVVMAAGQMGINVTAAVAGLGVAGIAIGLAAQDSIANAIAGVTIFLDKPFKVGDWITASDVTGKVAEIKMRTTRIRTRQHTYMVVPNKHIVDTTIVNHSMYGDVRIDIPIGIAYREDVRAARRVILEAIEGVELIRPGRSEVVLASLGDSSVNLSLRVWVDDPQKETHAHFACLEAAKLALDAAGIQIPYPHLQLFLERLEEPAVEGLRRALAG